MADRNVRIVVEAITKGQRNLESLNKSINSFGDTTKKLQAQLAQGLVGRLPQEFAFLEDVIAKVPVGLLAAGGALATVGGALAKLGLQVKDNAIEFDKLSQKTGASVEFLSGLQSAVSDADLDVAAFTTGIVKFADNLSRTVGPAADIEQELYKLADRFAQMPDGAQKTAEAIDAFGRSGAELIPILNNGSTALKETLRDMQAAGRVMSTETVIAAKALDDQLDKLNGTMTGLKIQIGSQVVPQLLAMAQTVTSIGDSVKNAESDAQLYAKALQEVTTNGGLTQATMTELEQAYLRQVAAVLLLNPATRDAGSQMLTMADAAAEARSAVAKVGPAALLSGKQAQDGAAAFWDAAGKFHSGAMLIEGARAQAMSARAQGTTDREYAERLRGQQLATRDAARYAGVAADAYRRQNNAQAALIPTQDKLARKGSDLTAAYRNLADQINANKSANERYGKSWDDLTKKISGGGGAVKEIDEQLKALEDRAKTVQGALGGGQAELSKNEKLQTAYAIATGELSAEQFQLQQAIKAVVAANEAGALSTEQALTAALSASQGLAGIQDLFQLAGDAGKPFAATAAEIIAAAETASTKVAEIKTRIGALPDSKTIELAAKIIGGDNVDKLRQQMEFLIANAKTAIVIDVVYRQTGAPPPPNNPPGAALGGNVFGWTWVGERGPELVYFGQPAHVFSNTQSKQIASGGDGGAGVSVVVNVAEVTSGADINSLAWRVADEIQKRRRNG